ncbi:MAG: hypothetical protein HOY78_34225, partial [Saccharothrix sp.]|nr:hypothetical protein [Saccharothrix sp.]
RSPAAAATSPADGFGRLCAGVAGLVCVVACARNLDTVRRLAGERWPIPPVRVVLAAGVVAAGGVALLAQDVLRLDDLLSVPNAMALAVFATAAGGSLVRSRGAPRVCAALALLGYAVLAPFAGAALLWPAAVVAIAALTGARPTAVP